MNAFIGLSDVGCVRKNNEDSFLLAPDLGLYIVADGMGGAEAGEVASRMAVERVRDFVASSPQRNQAALVAAFDYANASILDASSENPARKGMGTTLVAVLDLGEEAIVASVGDSRVWLLEHGRLGMVTSDQTWVNEVGKPLGIADERLRTHPMRHVLTMAVGVGSTLRVQAHNVKPSPGSLMLLSSDGLHGPVPTNEIEKILREPISLEARCHSLIEAAKAAGGPDNITVVLLEF